MEKHSQSTQALRSQEIVTDTQEASPDAAPPLGSDKGPEPWHALTHRSDSCPLIQHPPWRLRPPPSPASPVTAPGSGGEDHRQQGHRRAPPSRSLPAPRPSAGTPRRPHILGPGAGSLRRPPHVRTRPAGPRRRRRGAVLKEAKVLGGSEGATEVTKVSRGSSRSLPRHGALPECSTARAQACSRMPSAPPARWSSKSTPEFSLRFRRG